MQLQNRRKLVPERFGMVKRQQPRWGEYARAFLDPSLDQLHDPFLMREMETAVTRVESALASGEKIVVYGDYDVDGITATALLVRYLRWRGANVEYYIPHRVEDGYGLSLDGVSALVERGARLIITCDCAVTAVAEILAARQAGVLRSVFAINAGMFVAEFGAGLLIGSSALLGDSLDMLGDALVYGFSLYALGRSRRWRNGAALLKGVVIETTGRDRLRRLSDVAMPCSRA